LEGHSPTWSLVEASRAFPDLIGHLVYGGVTGLGFYALMTISLRANPELEEPVRPRPKKVVILGGGFGGLAAAQRLEQLLSSESDLAVTLVSESNYLLFTPMLVEVASSGLEAQHISAPVRAACPRTRFRRAQVESIDTMDSMVRVRAGESSPIEALPYDHLILALGSTPSFHGLPGLEENAFTLKTLEDATRLRNHVIASLERADIELDRTMRQRLLTFVVAGAGFAGMEMIAELFDLARSIRRYYPGIHRTELRFVLVHSRERVLPELSVELGEYARRKLEARGIEFVLGKRVAGATAGAVLLGDGSRIETSTLVWTAGNQPNPLLKSLHAEMNRAGQVVVDSTLQIGGLANVWAIGDCAQVPDAYAEGQFCPPTAQHALREGKVVAENVLAALHGKPSIPFRFHTLGTLVALGHRTAAAEIRGHRFSGLLAWLMWRTIYLSKLPGLEKKVRVAFDWALDLVFPRDIVLTADAFTPTLAQLSSMKSGDGQMPVATAHSTGGDRVVVAREELTT
ncbi:MAG: NAD(P)/FAD-dependent oxidoreductase, partial [Dehalococcoidia bacterium]